MHSDTFKHLSHIPTAFTSNLHFYNTVHIWSSFVIDTAVFAYNDDDEEEEEKKNGKVRRERERERERERVSVTS